MIYGVVCLSLVLAGFVQSVTGFGAGIVFMSIAPYFIAVTGAAAVSNFVSLMLEIMMAWRYRSFIQWRTIGAPALCFMATSTVAIHWATAMDVVVLKRILGVFLILLCPYMLMFRQKIALRPSWRTVMACGVFSGLCDGFFAVGGPMMVLYFLAITRSKEAYLGTLQSFFMICAAYSLAMRTYRGLFTADMVGYALAGTAAIFLGLWLGNRAVNRIDDQMMQKLVCLMIGLSGGVTLLSTL